MSILSKCTYVDPFSSNDDFALGVTARLNLFFFLNDPPRVFTVKLSAINLKSWLIDLQSCLRGANWDYAHASWSVLFIECSFCFSINVNQNTHLTVDSRMSFETLIDLFLRVTLQLFMQIFNFHLRRLSEKYFCINFIKHRARFSNGFNLFSFHSEKV